MANLFELYDQSNLFAPEEEEKVVVPTVRSDGSRNIFETFNPPPQAPEDKALGFETGTNTGVAAERAARHRQLAQNLGLDVTVVEGAGEEAERAELLRSFNELYSKDLTVTGDFLSDPANAQIASDSIDELSALEYVWKSTTELVEASYSMPARLWDSSRATVGGLMMNSAGEVVDDTLDPSLWDDVFNAPSRWLYGDEQYEQNMLAYAEDIGDTGREIYEAASADMMENRASNETAVGIFADDLMRSMADLVVAGGLTVATRSPAPGAMYMTATVFGQSYADGISMGLDHDQAHNRAAAFAVFEGITEAIPLGFLMKRGGRFLQRTLKMMAGEAIQETATEALQIGYDTGLLDESMEWGEVFERLGYAALLGGFAGGGVSVIFSPEVFKGAGVVVDDIKVAVGADRAARMGQIVEKIKGTKLAGRDPDAAASYLGQLIESHSDVDAVYVPVDAIEEQFTDLPDAGAFYASLGLTEEDVKSLQMTGGDVKMTGEQFARHVLLDSRIADGLLRNARYGSESVTQAEAEQLTQAEAEQLTQEEEAARDAVEQEGEAALTEDTADVDSEGEAPASVEGSRDTLPVEEALPEQVAQTFLETGQAQDDTVAQVSSEVRGATGDGVVSSAIDLANDLATRMVDPLGESNGGFESSASKVRDLLSLLQSEKFSETFVGELTGLAQQRDIPLGDLKTQTKEALRKYADAHRNAPVFNRVQWLGRQAAVAIGEQKFSQARDILTELAATTETQEEWHSQAMDYEIDAEGNLVQYDPGVIRDADPSVTGPVALAEHMMGLRAFFRNAREAAMTPKEYTAYLAAMRKRTEAATNRLRLKQLEQEERKNTKAWKAEEEKVRDEVREHLAGEPVYAAWNAIGRERLNREQLQEILDGIGTGVSLDALPKQDRNRNIYTTQKDKTGGIDPNVLAQLAGFDSGLQMVAQFIDMVPFEVAVERQTEREMNIRHGNIRESGQALREAIEALQDDDSVAVLAMELNALRDAAKQGRLDVKILRQVALERILQMRVSDVTSRALEQRAVKQGRLATRRLRAGDREGAAKAKFRQLVSTEMARQARGVREELRRNKKYMGKFSNPKKKFEKIEAGYVERIKAVLSSKNFGARVTQEGEKTILTKLREFADKRGAILRIPKRVIQGRKENWQDMTVADFKEVYELVKALEQQGIREKQIRVAGELREREVVIEEMLASSSLLKNKRRQQRLYSRQSPTRLDDLATGAAGVFAFVNKVEVMLQELDNGVVGGVWNKALVEPFSRAQTLHAETFHKVLKPLIERMDALPNAKKLHKTFFVPSLGQTMSRGELMMLLLNTGNLSNFNKVLEGTKDSDTRPKQWTEQNVLKAFDEFLTIEEVRWAQDAWDSFEGMWGRIAEIYELEKGVAPPKVEPRPFKFKGEEFRGGYFPMVYDKARAKAGDDASDALEAMQRSADSDSVFSGFLKLRTDHSGEVMLRIAELPAALQREMYFLSHYEAVRDVRRMLADPRINAAIRDKMGQQNLDLVHAWAKSVASGGYQANNFMNSQTKRVIRGIRTNYTAAVLTYKLTTLLLQPAGNLSALSVLGQKEGFKYSGTRGALALSRGFARVIPHPMKAFTQAIESSGELRTRVDNVSRESSEFMMTLRANQWPLTKVKTKVLQFGFTMIGYVQLLTVDIPVWYAALDQAERRGLEHEDAVRVADSTVRLSQGSGAMKDLPMVQQSTELLSWVTTFSTFFFSMFALAAQTGKNMGRSPKHFAQGMSRLLSLVALPVMYEVLIRGGYDDEEFEEDPVDYMLRKNLAYILGSVPVVGRPAASMVEGYTPKTVMMDSVPPSFVSAVTDLLDSDEDIDFQTAENLLKSAGYVGGLPGASQLAVFFDALQAAEDGHDVGVWDFVTGFQEDDK